MNVLLIFRISTANRGTLEVHLKYNCGLEFRYVRSQVIFIIFTETSHLNALIYWIYASALWLISSSLAWNEAPKTA